nr:MAG: internal scaffolding protein [Microvirus sp.]
MKPAKRSQVDELQEEYSRATARDTHDLPDLARQEFREEVDVNVMLKRFGVAVPLQRQPQFGEADFDLDLHSAHIAVSRAHQAFQALSPELRKKYETPARMLDAMNSGELRTDLEGERDERERKRAADQVAREAPARAPGGASERADPRQLDIESPSGSEAPTAAPEPAKKRRS